jgi:AcrR family transcriptional regulator
MGQPKKRDQKTTKAKLLKAALDIFSKEGYDAATTRAIAKKAGVNESLIHRYFESKSGLFMALKMQYREEFVSKFLENYKEVSSLQEEIENFLRFKLENTRKNKKFFRLSISRAILDPATRDTVQSYAKMKPRELVERFERLRQKGLLRKDVEIDSILDTVHIFSFALCVLSEGIACITDVEIERVIKTTSETLVRGLAPKSK